MGWAKVFGINQDVIQIHNDKNIKFLDKDLINVALKDGRGIGKSKKNDLILQIAVLGLEDYFPFGTFTNSYPVVCIFQIQQSKMLGLISTIKQLANQEERILVLDCQVIEATIVDTKAETSIGLVIEEDWCPSWWFGRPDKAVGQIYFNVSLKCLLLHRP